MIEKLATMLFARALDRAYEEGYETGKSAGATHAVSIIAQRLDKHDIKGYAVPEMVLGYDQARKAVEGVL